MKAEVRFIDDNKMVYQMKDIGVEHFGASIEEVYQAYLDSITTATVTKMLQKKYDGFSGVPYHFLQYELGVTDEQMKNIRNWIKAELEIKQLSESTFVPFELVSEMIEILAEEK